MLEGSSAALLSRRPVDNRSDAVAAAVFALDKARLAVIASTFDVMTMTDPSERA
jgi:hypothetical protein